jgi:hypothetical protein
MCVCMHMCVTFTQSAKKKLRMRSINISQIKVAVQQLAFAPHILAPVHLCVTVLVIIRSCLQMVAHQYIYFLHFDRILKARSQVKGNALG